MHKNSRANSCEMRSAARHQPAQRFDSEVPSGMSSLFDIAADLSQYNGDDATAAKKLQAVHPQSALGILDETFETIYGARQYRSSSRHMPLIRSTSMVHLQPNRLSETKSSDTLDARLNRLTSLKSSATAPRRVTPAMAVASLIVPPPPAVPPPENFRKETKDSKHPDVTAKAVLREITNEIEQLMTTQTRSPEEDGSFLRLLSEKYIQMRLSKLSGTPFVLLVRKKVAQKLEQLEDYLRAERFADKSATANMIISSNNEDSETLSATTHTTTRWRTLQNLSPAQHETLQNLLRLPEKQLLKLPKAQLELVHFARRYDKLVKATPEQLRHLPVEHQQLVRSMQQNQLSRVDERRSY